MPQQQADCGEVSADIHHTTKPYGNPVGAVEIPGPGDRRESARGTEDALHALQPVDRGNRVGVQPGQDVALGGIESSGGRPGDPHPRFGHHFRAGRLGDGRVVVCAAVVHDDDLIGLTSLPGKGIEADGEHFCIISAGDDDGN